MKVLAYHLRVKRVSGLNQDSTPKIENILVKLVGATSLDKYCKHINVRGFIKNEPPRIEKVLARDKDGKLEVLSGDAIIDAQAIVDKYINKVGKSEKVDYKSELDKEKKKYADLEDRLNKIELEHQSPDDRLEQIKKETDEKIRLIQEESDKKVEETNKKIEAIESRSKPGPKKKEAPKPKLKENE